MAVLSCLARFGIALMMSASAGCLLASCADGADPDPHRGPLDSGVHPSLPGDAATDGRTPGTDAAPATDANTGTVQKDSGGSLPDASYPVRDAGSGSDGDDGGRAMDAGTMADATTAADAATATDASARDAGTPDAALGSRAKFVGNITTKGQVRSDFAGLWNQITPENEGKWGSAEPARDQMNWGPLDRIHDYAKQHGILFKAHTLVWGSQQPSWIAGLSQADQRAEVEEWIRLFCERYPDVALIDVVNEPPPHTTPPYQQALGGAGTSGWDWIVQAFKWARQYCPKATLMLNDYNNIEYGDQNQHFIDIVKAIKAAGAPIDAVGAQAHAVYDVGNKRTPTPELISARTADVKRMLDKLANDTGLPVYITEYDIQEANDERQRQIMEAQFKMFWTHPAVKGITLWGYVVGATWVPNSGLMSDSGQKRPALTWLLDFLAQQR